MNFKLTSFFFHFNIPHAEVQRSTFLIPPFTLNMQTYANGFIIPQLYFFHSYYCSGWMEDFLAGCKEAAVRMEEFLLLLSRDLSWLWIVLWNLCLLLSFPYSFLVSLSLCVPACVWMLLWIYRRKENPCSEKEKKWDIKAG